MWSFQFKTEKPYTEWTLTDTKLHQFIVQLLTKMTTNIRENFSFKNQKDVKFVILSLSVFSKVIDNFYP